MSVYRFGELWILFMGVRVSKSVALLRICPPLSVKSAVAHANTNAHASILLHGKMTVTYSKQGNVKHDLSNTIIYITKTI